MGYNSPFIRSRDRYHEVQIPIVQSNREKSRPE